MYPIREISSERCFIARLLDTGSPNGVEPASRENSQLPFVSSEPLTGLQIIVTLANRLDWQ